MDVKVRFPPSPTGNLHVGSVRTALFNFLFARKNKGKLLLRIEDTDKKREVKETYQGIYDSLKWLGLDWDEGPILQSERLKIYKEHSKLLLDKGIAYKAEGAVFLKTKKEGQTKWIDLIGNKQISFDNATIDDFVIYKSNGFPTYHFANVVDDHLMGITHVLRGADIMSSTPKQLMLYYAFDWELPKFGHFPVILATDRSKLSKRHGAIGILDFKKMGFLPEALVNYLALLGWTPPSGKEVLSLEEMIGEFELKDIHTSSAVFDITKLDWMNGEYIRKTQNSKLKTQMFGYLKDISGGAIEYPTEDEIEKVIPLVKERIKKLSDFIPLTDFLWERPEYEREVFDKLNLENTAEVLQKILEELKNMVKPWDGKLFEETFRNLAEELNISASQMFQLIRVAVSGQLVTPPLFECIKILGEEEVLKRIEASSLHLL